MTLSRHPDVVCMTVAGGAVLLHTRNEIYYGLNSVGVRVWDLLRPDVRDLDELCAALSADYPDVDRETLRADVIELLESLESSGLVVAESA